MTKVAVLIGSLQQDSKNKRLALAIEKLAPQGVEFQRVSIAMPLFNHDIESNYPPEAQQARDTIAECDGVLIVSPEYNRSVPGVLKNAIDWLSRPGGNDVLKGKPVAVTGASDGMLGTAVSQYELKHILGYIGSEVMHKPEVYFTPASKLLGSDGSVSDERWRDNLKAYIESFIAYIESHK